MTDQRPIRLREKTSSKDEGLGAVRRAMAILKYLAQTSPVGSRLSEIAAATGLPQSTTHRLLHGLADEGMVMRERSAGRLYKLEPFALGLGPEASQHHFAWFTTICRPSLEHLAAGTGHAAKLTVRVGRSGLSLDIVHGRSSTHPSFARTGDVGFMGFGSASVVLLAALPEAMAEEILWDNRWLLDQAGIALEKLQALIADARQNGNCYSERAFVPDLCAASICIPNLRGGLPFAALTLLAKKGALTSAEIEQALTSLKRQANAIGRRIADTVGPRT